MDHESHHHGHGEDHAHHEHGHEHDQGSKAIPSLVGTQARRSPVAHRDADGAGPTTPTRQLRELERDGLVTRTQYNEIPPRVECDITDTAHTLIPVLEAIAGWTTTHGRQLTDAVASGHS